MERDLHKAYLDSLESNTGTSTAHKQCNLWAVSSGKGGVGKTFFASSLAITLSKLGHSVVLVDLDLSGGNIHTSLGLLPAKMNIRHYFEGSKTLSEILTPTAFINLRYIQGLWDSWTPTGYSCTQIDNLIFDLKKISADYVIVDIGSGPTDSYLRIFKAADEKFLITTPEPTSIEKTYRFIEAFVCETLKDNATPDAYQKMIGTLRDYRQKVSNNNFSFRSYLKENSGIQLNYFESLSMSPVRLVVNQTRSQGNIDLGYSMKSICNKYYDLYIDYLGAIHFDNAVWQSARVREHVLSAQPFTPLAGQFLATCKLLIDPEELRAVV